MSTSHPHPQPSKSINQCSADDVPDRLAALNESPRTTLLDIADAGENWVCENPWESLVAAAGIGFLLGVILSQRGSDRSWDR